MDQSIVEFVVAPAIAAARVDLYTGIHKAMRMCVAEALLRIGRMDPNDPEDVAEALTQTREMLDLCAAHLEHENRFVHPAMESRQVGSAERTSTEHGAHEQAIAGLRAEIEAVARATEAARPAASLRLYRRLGLFTAENLEHMHVEETHNMAVLWATHTDEELGAIESALVASIPPAQMARFLRWIIPSLAHGERVAMLSGIRAAAPVEAFAGAVAIARERLDARAWARLAETLGLHATEHAASQ